MRYTAPQWRPSLARRRTPLRSVVDVSTFVGIVLVLSVLFAALTLKPYHEEFPLVDLPTSSHAPEPDGLYEHALIVTIVRDGSTYLGTARMSPADLSGALGEALSVRLDRTVYINADARAKYADVQVVFNLIRSAGATDITFLTESRRP